MFYVKKKKKKKKKGTKKKKKKKKKGRKDVDRSQFVLLNGCYYNR